MSERSYHNQTAARALAALEILSSAERPLPLSELSTLIGCSKSSLFPIVKTLEERGYVRAEPTGRGYVITPRVVDLARKVTSERRIRLVFDDVAKSAVATVNELMILTVLDGDSAVCIGTQAPATPEVQLSVDLGRRMPAHACAAGKALLSGISDQEIHERIVSQSLRRVTAKTVSTLDALLEDLDVVRREGVAEDWQELTEGIVSLAAPVRSGLASVVGAIAFLVPTVRAQPESWASLRRSLLGAATEMSGRLGFGG